MVATLPQKMVVTFRDGMWYGFNGDCWIELAFGDVPFETVQIQLRRQGYEATLKIRTA